MALIACTVFLPVENNDGVAVPEPVVTAFRTAVLDFAGGFTILPRCHGVWRDDEGKVFVDQHEPILVALEEGTNQEAELARALLSYNQHADQQAYFIQVGSECRILSIPELTKLADGWMGADGYSPAPIP